jgi:hypothetical protein
MRLFQLLQLKIVVLIEQLVFVALSEGGEQLQQGFVPVRVT